MHQYETSLLQNDLWRDLSGEGQKGVKVSAVSEKIRKLAGRGSRRAGKGKGPKAGRGRARNFTDGLVTSIIACIQCYFFRGPLKECIFLLLTRRV
jgi:hypothetical protein